MPHYTIEPAPRANPHKLLAGAWIVRDDTERIVARFSYDGRDRAESWVAKHDKTLTLDAYPTDTGTASTVYLLFTESGTSMWALPTEALAQEAVATRKRAGNNWYYRSLTIYQS
jgi:hypothetical protein